MRSAIRLLVPSKSYRRLRANIFAILDCIDRMRWKKVSLA